jgi:hypothetical protein
MEPTMFKPLIVAAAALALAAPAATASPALAQTFETSGYPKCNAGVLSFIPPIVRREAVAAVKPGAHVSVHQICRGYELNDFGNAAGLTRTIAANPTLARALASWGWRPDNVVGINILNDRSVILYVYQNPALG